VYDAQERGERAARRVRFDDTPHLLGRAARGERDDELCAGSLFRDERGGVEHDGQDALELLAAAAREERDDGV
jgi:hypothetical protein